MEPWLRLGITIAVCAVTGTVFFKLKVPGGLLLGAVLGAMGLSMLSDIAYMPAAGKLIAQITAGAFIGCTIDREDLSALRTVYRPAAVMLLSLLCVNLVIGLLLWAVGYADLLSCLMCGVPGGLTDVILIAADMGADMSKVSVIHFARVLAGIGMMPSLIMLLSTRRKGEPEAATDEAPAADGKVEKAATPGALLLVFTVSTGLALLAQALRIPAGAITFAIIGAMLLKLAGLKLLFPKVIKQCAQILSGAFIGCQMDFTGVQLGAVALAIVIAVAGYILNALITGLYMAKRFSMPLKESMLILTPAGASDMALISADMGFSSPRLVLLHICRLLIVTISFPQLLWWIASLAAGG